LTNSLVRCRNKVAAVDQVTSSQLKLFSRFYISNNNLLWLERKFHHTHFVLPSGKSQMV